MLGSLRSFFARCPGAGHKVMLGVVSMRSARFVPNHIQYTHVNTAHTMFICINQFVYSI